MSIMYKLYNLNRVFKNLGLKYDLDIFHIVKYDIDSKIIVGAFGSGNF